MRALRDFSEFVKTGIIRKRRPDPARSKSLASEADKRRAFLKELRDKIPISEENANYYVEGAYDVLISLIRAKLLLNGYSSAGEGALYQLINGPFGTVLGGENVKKSIKQFEV